MINKLKEIKKEVLICCHTKQTILYHYEIKFLILPEQFDTSNRYYHTIKLERMKKQELFNNATGKFPYQRQPGQMGLYDAAYEHDACGVGMLVNIHGEKSHDIVESALKVLENMRHRGAEGADNKTGDGAGIMLQIPHEFILLQGIPVPKGTVRHRSAFLPKNE